MSHNSYRGAYYEPMTCFELLIDRGRDTPETNQHSCGVIEARLFRAVLIVFVSYEERLYLNK